MSGRTLPLLCLLREAAWPDGASAGVGWPEPAGGFPVDVRNSVLVVLVGVALGGAIILAAVVALWVYDRSGASLAFTPPRIPAPPSYGRSHGLTARPPDRRPVLVRDVRQVQRLESQLLEKTSLLNEKTALLNKTLTEHHALKEELEHYLTLASELMAGDSVDVAEDSPEEPNQEADLGQEDPAVEVQRLREDMDKATLLESALELELTKLKADLADANRQVRQVEEEAVKTIASMLEEAGASRDAAVRTVARIGAPAVAALVEMLSDQNTEARRWAAEMLGSIGSEAREAVPSLIEALADSDQGVRNAARQAIDAIKD